MSFNSSTQDRASQTQGAPRLPRPGPGLQAPRKRPGVAALWGLLLLLLMPWIAWVSVLPHLHELADQWAQQSAQSQGAVLYKTGYGLSSVVLVACWFISSVLVALAVERAWPELHRTRLVVEGWRVRVCRVESSNAPAAAGRALNRPGPARARRWKRRLRRSALLWMTALVLKCASVSFVVLDLRPHRRRGRGVLVQCDHHAAWHPGVNAAMTAFRTSRPKSNGRRLCRSQSSGT